MRQKNEQYKDLERITTSWDKNLVEQLIRETPFNHEDIKNIMINDHGILNRKIIKQKYGRLLEYSDFFGLPVWSLMTEDSAQEVMPSVLDELEKNIPAYRISDLEEILNYISVQSEGLTSLSNDDKTLVTLIVDILKKILHRHERWSKTWRVIFSMNQDLINEGNDHEWICNLLFTYDSEIIYRGTLRFYKKSLKDLPHKSSRIKDSYITSWFFIKKMISSSNKPRLIFSIVDDISTEIFTCQQPHISMYTENDDEMLFSWNSNFQKEVISIPDLTSAFQSRMRYLNKISDSTIFEMNELFYYNEHEWAGSFEDDNSSEKEIIEGSFRYYNTLEYLVKNGYIKSGDHILFKNGEDPYKHEFAKIVTDYKKPRLIWGGEVYHFTTLTKKLLNKQLIEITPNYCAKYWYLPDRQYSLYELANFIKIIHKF